MQSSLRQYGLLLANYLKPQSKQVVGLAIALLATIALQIINPKILGYFIDTAVQGGAQQALLTATVAFPEALNQLGLAQWLRSLPNGLDTQLEANSGGLSAGQAQLLAFVRVFLKNPSLVILDEASSRLDPQAEVSIEGAIDRLLRDRTGIIIDHRLQTVQQADQILILHQGKALEYGNRQILVSQVDSYFAQLLNANS